MNRRVPIRYGRIVLVCSAVSVLTLGIQAPVTAVRPGTQIPAVHTSAIAAALPGSILWAERYTNNTDFGDEASSVGLSPDGTRVFVTGYSNANGSYQDYATVAYDASTGAELWVSRYNGPENRSDLATSLGVSPDGKMVFVTGNSDGVSTGTDYATIAYDASSGAQLWVARYDGGGTVNDEDLAAALVVSPNGSMVFVTGDVMTPGPIQDQNYGTIAYDSATGSQIWMMRYSGPVEGGPDQAAALTLSADGTRLFVTGTSRTSDGQSSYATVEYDASTGSQLWVRLYNDNRGSYFEAVAVRVSPDGGKVFVTGRGDGDADFATVAYQVSNGAQRWVRRYYGPASSNNYPSAICVSPDGTKVFVTGRSPRADNDIDFATIAYDASTGARVWVKRFTSPPNGTYGDDEALAIAVAPGGDNVIVTGEGWIGALGAFAQWMLTVAYNTATGAREWSRHYGSSGSGNAVAVSPAGSRVFVAGWSADLNGEGYATVAYSTG